MRSALAVAALALVVSSCGTEEITDDSTIATPIGGELDNLFPQPDDTEETLDPPKTVYRVMYAGNIQLPCVKERPIRARCKEKVREAGTALYWYMRELKLASLQSAAAVRMVETEALSNAYAEGYNVACTGPTSSFQCLIRYSGAAIVTIALPEACVTVVLCAGAVAGAGLMWNDYFTYDDGTNLYIGTQGGYRYAYPEWNPDARETDQ
jgi:hypothetical protein